MFRPNDSHTRPTLFNTLTELPASVSKRLENSWAPLFYEHVFCKIDESAFAVLYSEDKGRPNFPVNILLGMEIIAAFYNYSVEDMLEQYYFNLQVRAAMGIRDIAEYAVAERTIYEFRQRLYAHARTHPGRESLVYQQFDSISDHMMSFTGIIREEGRMDSTQLMSNIRRAGRLSVAFDVLHQALRACPRECLPEELAAVLHPDFKNDLLYKAKAREIENRLHEILQLCGLLIQVAGQCDDLKTKDELQLLSRFLMEQADYDKETESWIAKTHEKGTTSKHIHSAYDPDATLRKKGDEVYVGYVANLTETCADENPVQFILDYVLEQNVVADTTMAMEAIPHLAENHGVKKLYVDGGYSGENVHDVAVSNNVSMYYTNMTGKETKKMPIHEFTFDGNKVTHCPAGHCSILSHYDQETGRILAHFDLELCKFCKAKHACPTSPKRQAQTISISKKQRIAAETRKQILDENQHRINTSKRAAIEGTNSVLKRNHGADKLTVRGMNKSQTKCGLIMLAYNFRQFVRAHVGNKRRSLVEAERRQRRDLFPVPSGA